MKTLNSTVFRIWDCNNWGMLQMEKGHLLEIHLLEKTARHQNLDCSTLFEQMPKKMKLLEKP
jgi:hypothetical protein